MRANKESVNFTCKLEKDISDKLIQYCANTKLSKTAVVEIALTEYLKKNMDKKD